MPSRWQPALLDSQESGGWALVHCQQYFLADGNGVLFPREWLKRQELPILAEHGLGYFSAEAVFLIELQQPIELSGCDWQGLRKLMLEGDAGTFKMLGYASQIGTWARQHRFCGSCGAAMRPLLTERAMVCNSCETQHYPRLSPSMIVLVTRGDEILLARSPRFSPGVYSTLAGFVEAGESVEDCVVREVFEEVGLEVQNLQYVASQAWPFPHSLMLGFHAHYRAGDIVMQAEEIEDARWFTLDALPALPPVASISRYLIDLYVARRLGRPEPVLPS
jgi:NAD+ diphosphatase